MEAIIVPCTEQKIWRDRPDAPREVPAKDAYTKSVFKKWKNYAEQSGAPWFILSTQYGLIKPDKCIENYNEKVSDACRNQKLKDDLRAQGNELGLGDFDKVILLDWEKFEPLVKAAIGDGKAKYELKKMYYC